MKLILNSFSLLTKLFFFILFFLFFATAKVYQFQAKNKSNNLQDVLLTFNEFVLELRKDGFFYNVEDNSKDIDLKDEKNITYTVEYKQQKDSKQIDLNGKIISIDLASFQQDEKKLADLGRQQAKRAKSIPASKFTLSQDEGRRIPGSGNDIVRSVAALPGVQGSADANGEIYIRGSDKDDIYYAINSIRISNPFHSMSSYSAIPNILINNLNIYLGGFDSKFYNSQGGVIQVETKELKDYPAKKINVEGEFGLSIAGINANIPILDNLRLNVGVRRSYYEVLFALVGAVVNAARDEKDNLDLFSGIKPYFFDANVFLDWDINKNHKLKVFTIFSEDGFIIKFPPIELPNSVTTNDKNEAVIETNKININMDTKEGWNVQAIEYLFKDSKKIENLLSIYRYSITNNTSILNRQLSFFTRDQYAIKDDFKFLLSKDFTISLGAFINFEIAEISVFENKDGLTEPIAEDYGLGHDELIQLVYRNPLLYSLVSLSSGLTTDIGDESFLENYKDFEKNYSNYTANLEEKKVSSTRLQMSGYAAVDFSLIEDFLIHTGVNSTFNTYSKKINFDPRINLSYFLLKQYTFSLKMGVYSQLPDLYLKDSYTVDPKQGIAIIQKLTLQQDNLKTPYSYHVNFGVNTTFLNLFQVSIDGYFKYMQDQILANPTYDTKFEANFDNNPRSINAGKGQAYGVDIFIKQRFFEGNFGWISYSWTKSLRYQFISNSYAFVGTDPNNNGNDYKNVTMGWTPFSRTSEHMLRIVYSLTPNKEDIFGLKIEVGSGLPYTPKVIDKRYVKKDGSILWSVRDGALFSRNYPLQFKVDFRYDRIVAKFFGVEIGYFIDMPDLQKYLAGVLDLVYSYSLTDQFTRDLESAQRGEGPLKDFKDGDPVPDGYYINSAKKPGSFASLTDLPIATAGFVIKY